MSIQSGKQVTVAVPASWGKPARWIRRLAVNVHGLHLVWLNVPRPFRVTITIALVSGLSMLGIDPVIDAAIRYLGR